MVKKIFLFNGPPRVGKDCCSEIFYENRHTIPTDLYKMALPLKESCHKMLGLIGSLSELEHLKEQLVDFEITDEFIANNSKLRKPLNITYVNGVPKITLRQFYIHVSENLMKPMYGNDIFGKLAVKYVSQFTGDYVAISDSGFYSEVQPLIEHFGLNNFVLVRLYRDGTDFGNDSRDYIDVAGMKTYNLYNNGTLDELREKTVKIFMENNSY